MITDEQRLELLRELYGREIRQSTKGYQVRLDATDPPTWTIPYETVADLQESLREAHRVETGRTLSPAVAQHLDPFELHERVTTYRALVGQLEAEAQEAHEELASTLRTLRVISADAEELKRRLRHESSLRHELQRRLDKGG